MNNDLKPCPFCGSTAELRAARSYVSDGWRVWCTKCRIGTTPVWIDHPLLTSKGLDESTRYTREQAAGIAVGMWNRRAKDAQEKAD